MATTHRTVQDNRRCLKCCCTKSVHRQNFSFRNGQTEAINMAHLQQRVDFFSCQVKYMRAPIAS